MPPIHEKSEPLVLLGTEIYTDPKSGEKMIAHFKYSRPALHAMAKRALRNRSRRASAGPLRVNVFVDRG